MTDPRRAPRRRSHIKSDEWPHLPGSSHESQVLLERLNLCCSHVAFGAMGLLFCPSPGMSGTKSSEKHRMKISLLFL